jgi:ketosteroid isomerase-like protein
MKRFGLLIIVLSLVSCLSNESKTSTTETTPTVTMDIEKELLAIEAVRTNFSSALKEGRYEDMGLYVTKDAKTIRPGGTGWDAMFALGKERGRFPYDSIIMQPLETHIISDSMAYDFGTSRVFYTNEEGEPVELNNSFLVLLKKDDGQWKLHREVGSSVVD